MIKKLGRFVMLGIAIAFIVVSIFRIKDCVNQINEVGGWNKILEMVKTGDFSCITDMGWGILYILVGLSALAVAVSGHAGFWTFIASALMLGFFIFDLVGRAKSGQWEGYKLPLDIIFQLVYVGGILLVMYGNHREKKAYRNYKKNQ